MLQEEIASDEMNAKKQEKFLPGTLPLLLFL